VVKARLGYAHSTKRCQYKEGELIMWEVRADWVWPEGRTLECSEEPVTEWWQAILVETETEAREWWECWGKNRPDPTVTSTMTSPTGEVVERRVG